MRKMLAVIFLLAASAGAQTWDATKPPTSGALVSADIRSNWVAIQESVGTVNLVADPTFIIWPEGDSTEPAHWDLTGTGATIVRNTSTYLISGMTAAISSGAGAAGILQQSLLDSAVFLDVFQSQPVSCGAWVRGAAVSALRLSIYDGVGTSYSDYASNGTWSWETVTRTLDASATELTIRLEVASGTLTGYVDGVTCVLGPVPPLRFHPPPVVRDRVVWFIPGTLSTGNWQQETSHIFDRPALVEEVQVFSYTAPTSADLIIDVNQYSGNSMFTSGNRPTVAASGQFDASAPDGTYQYRCFKGQHGTTIANSLVYADIDQVGSGTAGANLTIWLRFIQFAPPLEAFRAYDDEK